jgi:hypothetical protein
MNSKDRNVSRDNFVLQDVNVPFGHFRHRRRLRDFPDENQHDENLPGTFLPRRASISQLVGRSFLHQMKVLLAPARRPDKNPQLFEVEYPFRNGDKQPFGEVRVIVDPALLATRFSPACAPGQSSCSWLSLLPPCLRLS